MQQKLFNAYIKANPDLRGTWDVFIDDRNVIVAESYAVAYGVFDGLANGGEDPTTEVGEIVSSIRAATPQA